MSSLLSAHLWDLSHFLTIQTPFESQFYDDQFMKYVGVKNFEIIRITDSLDREMKRYYNSMRV